MTVNEAIIQSVRDDIAEAWPYPSAVLDAIHDAVAEQGVPLPCGAHLWLPSDGERGADVVMVRTLGEVVEVLTDRGVWVQLSSDRTLRLYPTNTQGAEK